MPRPSKPLTLHILHGTGRKGRISKRENELHLAPGSIGECPKWVSPESKEEWRRLLKTEWSKVLSPAYRSTFLRYCILHGRHIRAERGLKRWLDGKESAEAIEKMGSQEPAQLHSLAMQLGLTPASQSKVIMPPTQKPKSKWDEPA